MTDPAQKAAGANPEAGGNDQPEYSSQEGAVIELSYAGDDETSYGGNAGTVIIAHNPSSKQKQKYLKTFYTSNTSLNHVFQETCFYVINICPSIAAGY